MEILEIVLMSLIRPSPVEYQVTILQSLQPDRPRFYESVVQIARNVFLMLGFDGSNPEFDDKVGELQVLIRDTIEIPFEAPFVCVVRAYDNPRFYGSRKAYTIIGEGVDAIEVTKFHIEMRLDYIKEWCYQEVMRLTPYIRFVGRQVM